MTLEQLIALEQEWRGHYYDFPADVAYWDKGLRTIARLIRHAKKRERERERKLTRNNNRKGGNK